MCTVIDADCILANLLQSRDEVTVRDLNQIRMKIERRVPSVYVDVTKDCLVWATNQRPEMFSLADHTIRRRKQWTRGYVDEFFNWRIPFEVRETVLEALGVEHA
ncbi:hypothetical protein ACFL5O_10880 [Myxococcota bacterium]